jgi:hypothetical protein
MAAYVALLLGSYQVMMADGSTWAISLFLVLTLAPVLAAFGWAVRRICRDFSRGTLY